VIMIKLRGRRRAAAVATAIGILTGLLSPVVSAAPAEAAVADPASYVNPLIGTGSGGDIVGQVDEFPGAAAPFGMLTLSPQTAPMSADGGGYYYDDSQITGFALTHISGPGCSAYGDVPILPTSGAVPANPYTTTDSFTHTGEEASPGYYQVSVGSPAIEADMTATTRTGLADFTFPSGSPGNVLFKPAASQNGDSTSTVQVVGDDEVQGQVTSGGFCGSPGSYPLYYVAKFNRPFSSFGTWQQQLQPTNLLGTSQTGTLAWGGPDNDGCSTNTGSLSSVSSGAAESWTASCVTSQTWVQVTPQGLQSGTEYQASVTLEANSTSQTAPMYLDFYNGCVDTSSSTVTLTPGTPVTLTDTSTVGCSNTPQFQVRTAGAGSTDVTISNASLQEVSEAPEPGVGSASGSSAAAYATFATGTSQSVQMQVAISYVSSANAWQNLAVEQGATPNFNSVEHRTRNQWNQLLNKIQVSGGTTDDLTTFYTALYHALLDPSVFSDVNGQYRGFDNAVHTLPPGQGAQYANFSGWDIYRSEVQLLAVVAPAQTGDMMQSLVNDAAQGGWLPKWPLANDYTGVMNGDAADQIIADAYAFGVRNFNVAEALQEMVKGATQVPTSSQEGQGWYVERPQLAQYLQLGYTPNVAETDLSPVDNGASQTLEYALGDFGISQVAQGLGQRALAAQFARRGQNWEQLLNPNNGYLQPRDDSGNFPVGDPLTVGFGSFGQSGFQEGNAAQYNWAAPQNVAALVNLMGGQAQAAARLDNFFTQLNAGPNEPYYWAGNEPDLNAPWLYDYVGQPYRTQALVRLVTTSLYSDTPGGEPGNDDLGAMSSWLVWADLGLYPETAGSPVLALGSPLFTQATVHLPSGNTLLIKGDGAGDTSPYVTSLTVNGTPTTKAWVSAGDVLTLGGVMRYTLSSEPDPAWGSAVADAPPSYTAGQAPAVVAPAGMVQVAPGSSGTGQLTVANATTQPQPVSWSLQVPAGSGLTADAASGTATIPAGGGSIPISISAAAGAPQTFTTVTVTAADGSQTLPTQNLLVQVAQPGTLASYFNNRGVSDDSNTVSADFDGGGYSYSAEALAGVGVTPGSTVTSGSAEYSWPISPAGDPDNVQADGQTVTLNAAAGATSLDLLASASNGTSTGTLTLTYSDGSTATVPITVTDWAQTAQAGNTVAIATPYRNCPCGSAVNATTNVYNVTIPLNAALGLVSVTFPADATPGQIHVFALTTSS
jgi:predicted alpha-1,2-mannosidase